LFFDSVEHEYIGEIKDYNYNTLEPCLLRANNIEILNSILDTDFDTADEILKYMKNNKTECALKIFETDTEFDAPEYIENALEFINA